MDALDERLNLGQDTVAIAIDEQRHSWLVKRRERLGHVRTMRYGMLLSVTSNISVAFGGIPELFGGLLP